MQVLETMRGDVESAEQAIQEFVFKVKPKAADDASKNSGDNAEAGAGAGAGAAEAASGGGDAAGGADAAAKGADDAKGDDAAAKGGDAEAEKAAEFDTAKAALDFLDRKILSNERVDQRLTLWANQKLAEETSAAPADGAATSAVAQESGGSAAEEHQQRQLDLKRHKKELSAFILDLVHRQLNKSVLDDLAHRGGDVTISVSFPLLVGESTPTNLFKLPVAVRVPKLVPDMQAAQMKTLTVVYVVAAVLQHGHGTSYLLHAQIPTEAARC